MVDACSQFIYNEAQKCILKRNSNEKICILRLTVESRINHQSKQLNIKVTDDTENTFLYSLVLTQEDFVILKAQQGLLVDFDNFHNQFARLLCDCNSSDKPQFSLILDDSDPNTTSTIHHGGLFLKVIERNDFKYLCHLCLRLAPASDEDIKQHLSSKVKHLQEQIKNEIGRSRQLDSDFHHLANELAEKTEEIKQLEVRHAKEVSEIRLNASQEASSERSKFSNERLELESKHHGALLELQEEVRLLNYRNTIYHEEKCTLESSLKEISMLKENVEKEVARLRTENTDLKNYQNSVENRLKRAEENLEMSVRKIGILESNETKLTTDLEKFRRELMTARENEAIINSNLMKCQRDLNLKADEISRMLAEKTGLEHELVVKQQRIVKLTQVGTMLEKDKEKAYFDIQQKEKLVMVLEQSKKEQTKEILELKSRLDDTDKKLQSQEATVKKQEKVISFLNRKLSEANDTQNSTKNAVDMTNFTSSAKLAATPLSTLYTSSLNGGGDPMHTLVNRNRPPTLPTKSAADFNATTASHITQPIVDQSYQRIDPSYLSPVTTGDPERGKKKADLKATRKNESAYFPRWQV